MKFVTKIALASASYATIMMASSMQAPAQEGQPPSAAPQGATRLPPVQVDAPKLRRSAPKGQPSRPAASRLPIPPAETPPAPADTQEARTGTVGVYSNSTSVATKVNTPLVNIPQSVSVVTKEFIKDQNFQSVTDVTRYVPGVAIHQGEGNRDELVIRGVDSSANFFVNGFRDDVQYFRDLYNTQSIEVLKGPSALTFGRGAGGGLVNRTLKEADFTRIYEATAQTGSYWDRRVTLDAGQAINENFAARLNVMYEGSDTFRDFGKLERYGVNPTVTYKPNDTTKVRLSYEYYHDERTADRGNPSQALSNSPPASTRFNPALPFAPNGDLTAFFGSPNLNVARATVQTGMAIVEHDFQNGLTVKNSTIAAQYLKFYQNVYPGNGPLAGAVNLADTAFNRAAYNNTTNRDNLFNQTDFVYKGATGPVFHTVAFGTEFGRQSGISFRRTGIFPDTGKNTTIGDPFNPTYFGTVDFIHHDGTNLGDGVTTPDANSKYHLNIQSAYARDTIEITRFLQLIAGARFDRFDLTATDQNRPATQPNGKTRERVDDKVSPQAAVILKPIETLSIYGMYSVSYLPASGDQFSTLNDGTLILEPQKFENKEVGVKWNINPRLLWTAAVYDLERTNVPIADPNNAGFFLLSGSHRIRGFETALNGYVTRDWQSVFGYAYTDARITSDTSLTVVAGNRVQLVPFHQFSWWNKYQITPVWAASVGLIYFSDSFASSDNTVKLPGFFRVDAGIYAKINETWRAQLNVENIFDKGYWASADGNNNLSPGNPRTFRLLLTARF
jgi:catecholate siderophore receptor